MKILSGCFMDCFGDQAKFLKEHFPPFTYTRGCGIAVDDMSIGLDFGLIPLDGLTKQCFERNGVKPIMRRNWIDQPIESMRHFRLLGIPENEVSEPVIVGDKQTVNLSPVMVTVFQRDLESIPDAQSADCFAAQIHDDAKLKTVKGMSGGPIYGFSQNVHGEWQYHVVALQSRQPPDDKSIIFGCSLELFAERAYQAVAVMLGKSSIESGTVAYPIEEFLDHYKEFNDSLIADAEKRKRDPREIVREFMASKYDELLECKYRVERFIWINKFIDESVDALVAHKLVLRGEDESVSIADRLLVALHHIYTRTPLSVLVDGVSMDRVLEVVAEIDKARASMARENPPKESGE